MVNHLIKRGIYREKRFGRAKFAETVEKEDLDHAKRGGGAF